MGGHKRTLSTELARDHAESDEVPAVPFCVTCFASLFAPTCSACNHKIIDEEATRVGGDLENELRDYHPACYKCSVKDCSSDSKGGMFIRDGTLLCQTHYDEVMIPKCIICKLSLAEGGAAIRMSGEIGRAVQQECRDRSRMPSSA
eukprot:TRINITY_DN47615_c0_g1_i1.p1 TRINITY_DN47615_c0_g1~~TRINITY_DN47615_c0_g1_i1.p1  ORF type:complete len:146 (+),score=14.05 TRINITY_DN47615_c0_g1_i1:143-580(+)